MQRLIVYLLMPISESVGIEARQLENVLHEMNAAGLMKNVDYIAAS